LLLIILGLEKSLLKMWYFTWKLDLCFCCTSCATANNICNGNALECFLQQTARTSSNSISSAYGLVFWWALQLKEALYKQKVWMCSVINFFKQLNFLFLRFKAHPMSKILYNLQEESSSFTDQLVSNKYSSVWYEWFFNIPAWSWYWILLTLPFTVETFWCT